MKVIVQMSGKDGKVKVGVDDVGEYSTANGYVCVIDAVVNDAIKAYKELNDEVQK